MLKTRNFTYNRNGRIDIFGPINPLRVIRICNLHARRKKTKKPYQWRFVPTLTARV